MNTLPFIHAEDFRDSLALVMEGGRFPHAILIEGAEGSGRKTIARFITSALLCKKSGEGVPCGECSSCKKMDTLHHPDVYIAQTLKNSPTISVDEIREIRQNAFTAPHESDKKVYIIPEAQHMSITAQNALLKVLEEPPNTVVFILTTNAKENLLETVVSRVTCLKAPVLDREQRLLALSTLTEQSAEELRPLVECTQTVGQALMMLSDTHKMALINAANEILKLALASKKYELLRILLSFSEDRESFKTLIIEARRQVISISFPKGEVSSLRCRRIADILKSAEQSAFHNVSLGLLATMLSGKLCRV